MPVELGIDRRARANWVVFTAGPVIWFGHFMLVYLVAEAGCTGDGPGLERLDPPVPVITTLVATVIAVALCAAAARWGWRWWRDGSHRATPHVTSDDGTEVIPAVTPSPRDVSLGFAGAILSLFSLVAVLFTAAPALVLGPC